MTFAASLLRATIASAAVMLLTGMNGEAAPETGREGVFSIGIPSAEVERPLEVAPQPQPALRDVQEARRAERASRNREAQIRQAIAEADWARALGWLGPFEAGECAAPGRVWARADALQGLGQRQDLQAFYRETLSHCGDPELVAGLLGRAGGVLDADGMAEVLSLPALSARADKRIATAYATLATLHDWRRFEAAQERGDLAAIREMAEANGDPRMLVQAGWLSLEQGPAEAAGYFRRALDGGAEEAREGLVLAYLAQGDYGAARRFASAAETQGRFTEYLARADLGEARQLREAGDWEAAADMSARALAAYPELTAEAENVLGGALLDGAGKAYERGDYASARRLAGKAGEFPSWRREAAMRGAWADLQSGEAAQAAATFRALYVAAPDDPSAEGFALAAQRSGQLGSAAAVAKATGGPLGAKVQAQYASAAFYGGDYLTARALAPERYEKLEGLGNTAYRQTFSMRQQDGARGQNRLTGYVSTTSVETVRGVSRYEAGLAVYKLDTGTGNEAGRETFAAPYLAWSREGSVSLAARVGLLPVGGGAPAKLTGEVAAVHQAGAVTGEVRGYVRPRMDSRLALAGDSLPGAGEIGRISETGALARARLDVGGGRAVQAELSAAALEGRGTAGNSMVMAGISASQAIAQEGFEYLVTGPFYQYQDYDRNSNFFSAGHGGYFSPQAFHRAGWSVNARTEPLKDWIVKADGAVAYETVREDGAFQFPLSADRGAFIQGGRSTGVAASADIALARRLGPEVMLTANLSATASAAFEDLRAGFGLVWVPGGRAALVPSDLATDPFSPASWSRP